MPYSLATTGDKTRDKTQTHTTHVHSHTHTYTRKLVIDLRLEYGQTYLILYHVVAKPNVGLKSDIASLSSRCHAHSLYQLTPARTYCFSSRSATSIRSKDHECMLIILIWDNPGRAHRATPTLRVDILKSPAH